MDYFYIGTWNQKIKEIPGKILVFSKEAGCAATLIQELVVGESVSKVRLDRKNRLLFAVLETREGECGVCGGEICVFHIEADKTLTWRQRIPSYGPFPIDFEMNEDFFAVVNHGSTTGRICRTRRSDHGIPEPYWEYDEASLVLYDRKENGELNQVQDLHRFTGSGEVPFFQESASPHSITRIPGTNRFLVPQRGTDKISIFEAEAHKLNWCLDLTTEPGQGPRNAVVCNETEVYAVNEILPLLNCYSLPDRKPVQVLRTIMDESAALCERDPRLFTAPHPVAVGVSEDERWIYVLTRSTDSLTVFKRQQSGSLKGLRLQTEWKLPGVNPRELLVKGFSLYLIFLDSGTCMRIGMDTETGVPADTECIISGIDGIATLDILSFGEKDYEDTGM